MKNTFAKITFYLCLISTSVNTFAENVVLINPFKVPAGQLESSIEFWEKARDFLQNQPGYVSTKLHQSLEDNSTFRLINVAEWESEEAFKAAIKEMKIHFRSEKIKPIHGLKAAPALYQVIRD